MERVIKYAIGADVSKDKFDVCLLSCDIQTGLKVKGSRKFSNNLTGFKEFSQWIKDHCKVKAPVQILMEATGIYYEHLAIWLADHQFTVFVVLPNKARSFIKALGLKTKNDRADAKGLAEMCARHQFEPWKPIAKYNYELRLLTRHYQSTQELRTSFLNQLHALEYSGYNSKQIIKQLKKSIALFEKQLKDIKKEIAGHIEKDSDVKRKVGHICKIKGIDILSAATIIAETNGFELFKNQAQLVSYAGYDVIENQSGQHTGKTKISKKGNSRIRRILHMPALNMVRFEEPAFLELYHRVYENTKIKMKAYVAVQKKLLLIIYALWKNDTPYDKTFKVKPISVNEEQVPSFRFSPQEKAV